MGTPTKHAGFLLRLGRLLGYSPIPADVAAELAALRLAVQQLAGEQAERQTAVVALREAFERLDRQVGRAGKEQFKTNSLVETQQQNVKSILEQLRDAETYRERELANLREKLSTARAEGRMEVVRHLLPALDGLDEALAAGERLLPVGPAPALSALASPEPTLGQRLRRLWPWAPQPGTPAPAAQPQPSEESRTLAAWLDGLRLVHERLLDVLAAEGVRPLDALGASFDPALHVVIETVPAGDGQPAGTIVREMRRGYVAGDTVLRYAEVVVAR